MNAKSHFEQVAMNIMATAQAYEGQSKPGR
jgi:hypothetical protein